MAVDLPPLPVPITDFVGYVNKHPKTQDGVAEAVEPFKAFENKLREVYAQHSDHPAATENHLLPVFKNEPVTIRARDLTQESQTEKDKYLLPLPADARRKDGLPATVPSLKAFTTNFNVFSESSLVDLDWSNVVCAGSAVVTSLLPQAVEAPHNGSKRALRSYYHETLAPASDVDLFLYGLTEAQATEKIKQIETKIRESILSETTTVRTKNAITIVSQYPTRHVQIVLRLYKSISEILTGFDVDCACVAYDGHQVWASPRALAAFMSQVNTIDLTRRSPSYENRLSKYSHRGFEVHWPAIDRSRVDPTVFERSFSRVQGLARLLVLEKLPHVNDREIYLAKRRAERGRPPLPGSARSRFELAGNVKDAQPDDVAEWVEADEVSNYHTVTIPYGPKYHARRIEKLLFTKDLLLNAEWNKPKDRKTKLHRHPAFFGSVDDVLHDCCGYCPKPITDEDLVSYEEERKIYISGDVTFLRDDPGRQSIGSFNPITAQDWTEMAYVGNTTRLCQAIVDQDLDGVRDWFSSLDVVDVNRRDHTGRTPLQLAVMCSTPEIVQYLIEHGARIVSRLYNGMTALHLASHRGEVQMVRDILDKSEANAEEEARKDDVRKEARRTATAPDKASDSGQSIGENKSDKDSFDADEDFAEEDDEEADNLTEGSFVKVGNAGTETTENDDEPDVYDIDVLAWDSPLSPLHLAILAGHVDVVALLVDKYGANVLLPVRIVDQHNRRHAKAAILALSLAMELPLQQANKTVKGLLALGATYTQADMNHISALHYAVKSAKTLMLQTMQSANPSSFANACNFIAISGYMGQATVSTPLLSAIRTGSQDVVESLVQMGAHTRIDFESFAQAYKRTFERASDSPEEMKRVFQKTVEQPVIVALQHEMLDFVHQLIDGEDINVLPETAYNFLERVYDPVWDSAGKSLLDLVNDRISDLTGFVERTDTETLEKPAPLDEDAKYVGGFEENSYCQWTASHGLADAKIVQQYQMKQYEKEARARKLSHDEVTKDAAIRTTIKKLESLARKLCAMGAISFSNLHPEKDTTGRGPGHFGRDYSDNEPYQTKISFHISDLTPEKEAKYMRLFEASFAGEQETVKSLCLCGERPLKISVQDLAGFSPFSLAVIRGHLELALLIVEIAKAQYQPEDKSVRYQYRLRTVDDYDSNNDDDGDDSDSDQVDDIRIHADIVDETFTVDDIAALASNVKSTVSPATMVGWRCQLARTFDEGVDQQDLSSVFGGIHGLPQVYIGSHTKQSRAWFNATLARASHSNRRSLIRYAILTDNPILLKFLLKIGNELENQNQDEDTVKVIHIEQDDFNLAVRLGRVEMIGVIIKATGYGFPLQKLYQSAGLKLNEKPKYYQGLNVGGKKRQDWAEAGRRGHYQNQRAESDLGTPLLAVSIQGNLETTEYFMSDAPLRRYLEFAEASKDDKRIRALAQTKAGIKGTLESWLTTRNVLALHIGVLSPPNRDGSQPTFDFLLEKFPHALEVPSASGKTPLHLAFEVGRFHAARKLIAAGANQATKDNLGRNILHTILHTISVYSPNLLRSVLEILDDKIVPTLLLERCSAVESTGATPLGMCLGQLHVGSTDWEEGLNLLLSLSGGKDLEKLDGAGDYPLHTFVKKGHLELVNFIVEYRPGLLYWENATGMTVSDVVTTSYLRYQIDNPPKLDNSKARSIKDRPASEFVAEQGPSSGDDESDDAKGRSDEWRMYHLIKTLVAKYPAKRKLVALHDANEVAKRLALQQQKQNDETRRREALGGAGFTDRPLHYNYRGEVTYEKEEQQDEVAEHLPRAKRFTKWDQMVWRKTEVGETVGTDGKDLSEEYARHQRRYGNIALYE